MLLPVQLSIWIIFLFAFEEDISTPFVTIVEETSVKNVVFELFEFKYLTYERFMIDSNDIKKIGKLDVVAFIPEIIRSIL